ncbi:relaxase/mobilization nuclease family protein [Rhodococcus opacus M213]|uniref:Relaxase/mobilization nuclease family protein n=1 Tax=Rhodococcus opacus M213 TaxID=1129896 RepID=K8XND8_RHOOP|nr:relaxase/mobilization nuclease domain-containing protein [Rhodococcus opacus]EKT79747.1 relaxase/mobilization nuclease family protein [Rhodococcus opacus M213]
MMPNITKGARMSGLLVYLAGPGDSNEHTDQHVIAGHSAILGRDDFLGQLDRATALAIAHEVDLPRKMFGTKVERIAKGKAQHAYDSGTSSTVAVLEATEDINVWHCSLSLRAEEGQLTDEQWAQITGDFMEKMGFTATASGAPGARWVAIRHGLSTDGNDHVHIAASRVREDGTVVSDFRDWPRAQAVCGELEKKHGLEILESRQLSRQDRRSNASVPTRAEIEKATARRGQPSPFHRGAAAPRTRRGGTDDPGPERAEPNQAARVQLRQVVAETAATTGGPEAFLRELDGQGVLVYRRIDETGRMTGYAVADRNDTSRTGNPIFFAGSTLAPELSWPKLNAVWRARATPEPAPTEHRERTDAVVTRLETTTAAVRAATAAVRNRTEDPAPIAAATQGLLSQWARASERQSDRRDVARVSWRHADAARCAGAYGDPTQAGRCAMALRQASWSLSVLRTFTAAGRAHAPTMDLALAVGALLMELAAWHEQSRRGAHARAARAAADGCQQFTRTYRTVDLHGRPKTVPSTAVTPDKVTSDAPTPGIHTNPAWRPDDHDRGKGRGPIR